MKFVPSFIFEKQAQHQHRSRFITNASEAKYNDSYTSSKYLNLPLTIPRQIVREAISTIYDYSWCRISFQKEHIAFFIDASQRGKKRKEERKKEKRRGRREKKSYVMKKDRYTLCLLYPCRGSVQASGKGGEKKTCSKEKKVVVLEFFCPLIHRARAKKADARSKSRLRR